MNKASIFSLLAILLLLSLSPVLAQSKLLTGIVQTQEDQYALGGASVLVQETSQKIITNVNGHFQIVLPVKKLTLVFTYIGCVTQVVTVPARTDSLVVSLEEDVTPLSEVLIDHGTSAKEQVSNGISRILPIKIIQDTSTFNLIKYLPSKGSK